jgi:hypothetical protein
MRRICTALVVSTLLACALGPACSSPRPVPHSPPPPERANQAKAIPAFEGLTDADRRIVAAELRERHSIQAADGAEVRIQPSGFQVCVKREDLVAIRADLTPLFANEADIVVDTGCRSFHQLTAGGFQASQLGKRLLKPDGTIDVNAVIGALTRRFPSACGADIDGAVKNDGAARIFVGHERKLPSNRGTSAFEKTRVKVEDVSATNNERSNTILYLTTETLIRWRGSGPWKQATTVQSIRPGVLEADASDMVTRCSQELARAVAQ